MWTIHTNRDFIEILVSQSVDILSPKKHFPRYNSDSLNLQVRQVLFSNSSGHHQLSSTAYLSRRQNNIVIVKLHPWYIRDSICWWVQMLMTSGYQYNLPEVHRLVYLRTMFAATNIPQQFAPVEGRKFNDLIILLHERTNSFFQSALCKIMITWCQLKRLQSQNIRKLGQKLKKGCYGYHVFSVKYGAC